MAEADQLAFFFPKDVAKCPFQLEFLLCSSRLQSHALRILTYLYVYKRTIRSFFPHNLRNSSNINKKISKTKQNQEKPNFVQRAEEQKMLLFPTKHNM